MFVLSACFLIFLFFAVDVSGAPEKASDPLPTSHEAKKPAAGKAGLKPQARTSTKSKSAVSSKRKIKASAQPPVLEKTKAKAEVITSEISSSLPESLEKRISRFYGLRYRMGGEGRNGIDCSGLVQRVYSDVFGIELPRTSSQQSRFDSMERVTEDELQPGDLLFFGPKRKRVNHVGMYLASGYFLHASRLEGVTISRLDDGYWKSRWIFSKRVKGLEAEFHSDRNLALERTLEQDSAEFAFSGTPASGVGFIEGGIVINDSLEFLLSGFSVNALDDHESLPPSSVGFMQENQTVEMEGGFRLAAVLSPSQWFQVIPSVSRIESAREENSRGGSRQQLGLETRMILPSSRIAVFMAAHTDNLEDLSEHPLDVSPDWQGLDVALGLHYRLSDSFRFSLWGTRGSGQNSKENEESARRNTPLDDVSFQLNVKF